MKNGSSSVGWVLVIAIVVIGVRAIVLIALDIRAGAREVDAVAGMADFHPVKPDRIRHMDILDSLCEYPYKVDCYVNINGYGDTIIFSRSKDVQRFWWSLNDVQLDSFAVAKEAPSDPRSSYSANSISGIGRLPGSITRNTEPRTLQMIGIRVDSLIENKMRSGPIWSQRFRTRTLEFVDTANVLIASISARNSFEGEVFIGRRNSTTTVLLQWDQSSSFDVKEAVNEFPADDETPTFPK